MNLTHPMHEQTLISWIGDTELIVMADYGKRNGKPDFSDVAGQVLASDKGWDAEIVEQEIAKLDRDIRDSSILLTLETCRGKATFPDFSTVILLTNRPSGDKTLLDNFQRTFADFINHRLVKNGIFVNVETRFVSSPECESVGVDAWNYSSVYHATKRILRSVLGNRDGADIWYCITPGTIAQQMSLVLLGKEFSPNANNFIQVNKSKREASQCDIPFDFEEVVEKAIEERAAHIEDGTLPIIGKTPSLLSALRMADQIAHYPVTVLLTGETGVGKEVFARRIHQASQRRGAFIAVNCAMLSRETGVTELTGYFKGAYTGADVTTPGYYEKAKGGTLFLDEIGDCPLEVQAELLRFLQPIGDEKPTMRHWKLKGVPPSKPKKEELQYLDDQVGDILVIAATNRDVRDQTIFRRDLFYRLEAISIKIPSLEERKKEFDPQHGIDDIRELADDILLRCNEAFKFPRQQFRHFSPDAYDVLRAHVWLGNVRELKNAITRMVVLNDATTLTADIVCASLDNDESALTVEQDGTLEELVGAMARQDALGQGKTFGERIADIRRIYCQAALEAAGGKKKKAYTAIRLNPKTFESYLK